MDGVQADYQLLIDVRRFQITIDPEPVADIGLSARILNKNGKVLAARLFQDTQKLDKIEPAAVSAAFNEAFGRIARDMIAWTVKAL
jgi:phospholipid/cholesterol/gamma-HCH transport system substrate-binding protein